MPKFLSTQQTADKVGISKRQLLRWLYDRKIPEVWRQKIGGVEVRLWSAADVEQARAYKRENYKRRPKKKSNKRAR